MAIKQALIFARKQKRNIVLKKQQDFKINIKQIKIIMNLILLTLWLRQMRGPLVKYGDVNTVTHSSGEVKGLIIL